MNSCHIILNSNKWFSAVSDYSLQLAKYCHSESTNRVLYLAHAASPMHAKLQQQNILTQSIPLLPSGLLAFLKSWRVLSKVLNEHQQSAQVVVWTFEGREHTLCAIHKKIRKSLWKNALLVRVRGQAAAVKNGSLQKWLYTKATDRVVFAAKVVQQRTPFEFAPGHTRVFLYCAGNVLTPPAARAAPFGADLESALDFFPGVPAIDPTSPLFVVVGRYDPVKGHDMLLRAFAKAEFQLPHGKSAQLVFVGESQNVKASALYELAVTLLGSGSSSGELGAVGTRYFAASPVGNKKVFLYDERYGHLPALLKAAHFGVIPSFASEVICRVAVEFMQAGTPLLASRAGALPEVIHTKTEVIHTPCGLLFAPENEVELQCALEQGMRLISNFAEHSKMREAAFERGRNFELGQYKNLLTWLVNY